MIGHFFTRNELEDILDNCLGKTLGEVDVNNVFDKTIKNSKITGIAGDVIEQSVLGYPADNLQRPDLCVDGVDTELKTTGLKYSKNKTKLEGKEPMSITAVSPASIQVEQFESSNFWHKLEHLLLVYYLYNSSTTVKAADYANFPIKGYEFHVFSKEDEERLKNDWTIVRDFIIDINKEYPDAPESQYPRISSELRPRLVYLDTAPKWPHSPRFRLKRAVVTNIVQEHFGGKLEQLPGKYNSYNDVDNKCRQLTKLDGGKLVSDLVIEYSIVCAKISKSINEQILVRMFGGSTKKMNKIDMFSKFGIICKSLTLSKTGLKTEDTKFCTIKFDDWVNPDIKFEDSLIYDYFSNHQFLFMMFREPSLKAPLEDNVFIGFRRLSFSDEFINVHLRKTWDEVRYLVWNNLIEETICMKDGTPIKNKSGTYKTAVNLPKSENNVVFFRGTGNNAKDKREVLNGIKIYSQQVWVRGTYMVEELLKCPVL